MFERPLKKQLISASNPMGTDGFEFIEFTAPDPAPLAALFDALGFVAVARHRSKPVTLFRQGDISFILNAATDGPVAAFAKDHGPCANAMAFRVADAVHAFERALSRGAIPYETHAGAMELNIPAIEGIGESALYLVDRYGEQSIYDVDFEHFSSGDEMPVGAGLTEIDHVTHNVEQGHMGGWAGYYERLFNFREIRYFDIEGQHTGLTSKAMTGPCGKLRIPINESQDADSQIAEFIRDYRGEGIQHIALATDDICATVARLARAGVKLLAPPPDSYYDDVEARLPGHGQDIAALKQWGILIDGAGPDQLLLQIFTEPSIGPIFFEIIERRGDEGFGEGNFRALFEAMERDQIRRGTLSAE